MINNISSKALAGTGIMILVGVGGAIGTEVTKSYLHEIRSSIAELQAAQAETEKAKAADRAAGAGELSAINDLKSAQAAADALVRSAIAQANATKEVAYATQMAAAINAGALERSTTTAYLPENTMFQSVTGPMFADPAEKMAELNGEIVPLAREIASGVDSKAFRALSDLEIAQKTARKRKLDEELATLKETTSKNWSDTINMVMGFASSPALGGMEKLYPSMTRSEEVLVPIPVQNAGQQLQSMEGLPLDMQYALAKVNGVPFKAPSLPLIPVSKPKESTHSVTSWDPSRKILQRE